MIILYLLLAGVVSGSVMVWWASDLDRSFVAGYVASIVVFICLLLIGSVWL